MATQEKTFKVECPHCQRPFHIRYALADPDVEGSGEVVVTCQYCNENVMIEIPREYISEGMLLRGVKSVVSED